MSIHTKFTLFSYTGCYHRYLMQVAADDLCCSLKSHDDTFNTNVPVNLASVKSRHLHSHQIPCI